MSRPMLEPSTSQNTSRALTLNQLAQFPFFFISSSCSKLFIYLSFSVFESLLVIWMKFCTSNNGSSTVTCKLRTSRTDRWSAKTTRGLTVQLFGYCLSISICAKWRPGAPPASSSRLRGQPLYKLQFEEGVKKTKVKFFWKVIKSFCV
jgi:hypothetical protein